MAPWLISDPSPEDWDVVVVGTGMGGAACGYGLARAGLKVLFLEKGPLLHSFGGAGVPPATAPPSSPDAPAHGWWPSRVRARIDNQEREFYLPIGCGTGGSTAFYAAGLERFSPLDFEPRALFPHEDGSSLPDKWPIRFEELEPYYSQAEALLGVSGTQDPLHGGQSANLQDSAPLSQRDAVLEEALQSAGLHPYRLHVGMNYSRGCNGCSTRPCKLGCKRDAANSFLEPALLRHNAKLAVNIEVVKLESEFDAVKELVCVHAGNELRVRGRVIVLAAGAFATPTLLLRSTSARWPDGLANWSGQVGRNLMFHGGDFFAVAPPRSVSSDGPLKSLALNDFYFVDGQKLGTFQTLGTRLTVGEIMLYLRAAAESGNAWWRWLLAPRPWWWRKLTSPLVRVGAALLFEVFRFRHAGVWVSIIEDLPYPHNRVMLDPSNHDRMIIHYAYSDDLRRRVSDFRRRLKRALPSLRILVLSSGDKIDYPHVSGTCRFGSDPAHSVLNRENRAHGVANLYVVDASWFPSSGGTNPSLTIAANALRVADLLSLRLSRSSATAGVS
jgi:choline dehydrogenase-like flavoprotein